MRGDLFIAATLAFVAFSAAACGPSRPERLKTAFDKNQAQAVKCVEIRKRVYEDPMAYIAKDKLNPLLKERDACLKALEVGVRGDVAAARIFWSPPVEEVWQKYLEDVTQGSMIQDPQTSRISIIPPEPDLSLLKGKRW